MPKTASSSLFELSHSLSKGEKRFISSRLKEDSSVHHKLYSAILQQKTYDEEALKRDPALDTGKNLNTRKSFLYQSILRSLSEYHYHNLQGESQAFKLLNQGRDLFKRNLIKEGLKLIAKAELIAQSEENFPLLLLVLDHRQQSLQYTSDEIKDYHIQLQSISKRKDEIHQEIADVQFYEHVLQRINTSITERGVLMNKDLVKELERIRTEKEDHIPSSFTGQILRNSFLAHYHYWVHKDVATAFEHVDEIIKTTRDFPSYKSSHLIHYANYLYRHVYYGFFLQKIDTVSPSLAELKLLFEEKHELSFKGIRAFLFRPYISAETMRIFYEKAFDRAIDLAPLIEESIEQGEVALSGEDDMVILSNIGMLLAISEQWKEGFKWLKRVIDMKPGLREDIHGNSRLHILICLMEQGDYGFFESNYKSFVRYFKKKPEKHRLELTMLDKWHQTMGLVQQPKEQRQVMVELWLIMAREMKEKSDLRVYLSLSLAYVVGKALGIPIATVLREHSPETLIERPGEYEVVRSKLEGGS